MDGGGRLDQSLKRSWQSATRWLGAPVDEPDCARVLSDQDHASANFSPFIGGRRARRLAARLAQIPQGAGVAASLLLLGATLSYGAIAGGHVAAVTDWLCVINLSTRKSKSICCLDHDEFGVSQSKTTLFDIGYIPRLSRSDRFR